MFSKWLEKRKAIKFGLANPVRYTVKEPCMDDAIIYGEDKLKEYLKDYICIGNCYDYYTNLPKTRVTADIFEEGWGYQPECSFNETIYIHKEDLALLKKSNYDKSCKNILSCFCGAVKSKFVILDDGVYTDDAGEELLKRVYQDRKAMTIKGSDWPYWFDIEGVLYKAASSNYFRFLIHQFNAMDRSFLEEYNGPDKYEEHKNDSLNI